MPAKYTRITSKGQLQKAIRAAGPDCALDFETTALYPAYGRVRLVSLCSPTLRCVVDFDRIRGGFRSVASLFKTKTRWFVFNAGFELRWFLDAGAQPIIFDVENMRRAVLGGSKLSLKVMAKYDLDEDIDKGEQASDWGAKTLTDSQLDYAFDDADVTWRLYTYWNDRMDADHWRAAGLLNDMVPAVVEMEEAGMRLDVSAHAQLVSRWSQMAAQREDELREMVGKDEVANLASGNQWNDFFLRLLEGQDGLLRSWPKTEKTGQLQTTREALSLIGAHVREPWPELAKLCDTLSEFKKLEKYISSFGETLITKAQLTEDGRIRARFNIGAAKTCRFSSSGPNLQQVPRNQDDFLGIRNMSIRSSFIAARGCKLVSLDYSGIELRVLALLAEDEQLLHDCVEGDLHSEVASFGAGRKIDKSVPADKALRSAAKAVSFGIIYGSGATGLAATMKTTPDKAQAYIDFWARRYPKAFELRHKMMDEASRTRFLRMIDGGTIYMGARPDLPKCANYPVQRAALAVMARAIARHKASLDSLRSGKRPLQAKMLSTIHDALIDEVTNRDAKRVLRIMEEDMVQAYLDLFPGAPTEGLVEGGYGPSWGELD
jgi:DNA polymerase-1